MTVYVLGAGASKHAGYPLAREMGAGLLAWMNRQTDPSFNYAWAAEWLQDTFVQADDLEDLLTRVGQLVQDYKNGTQAQRTMRANAEDARGRLKQAIGGWFAEIREPRAAQSYACFASRVVEPGDRILTFNYDASLERELKAVGKWHIGDGYGFDVDEFPKGSLVKVLKLHGSAGWLALTSGLPMGGSSRSVSRVFADARPAVGSRELEFLGYSGLDPAFGGSPGAERVMIMPASKKEFFFEAGGEREWDWFWDDLWNQASEALRQANRVTICGYSMLRVDERACDVLLNEPNKDAQIIVMSGKRRTGEIVEEYQDLGYKGAVAAKELYFEDWVKGVD